eukprot:8879962-Pyramimonas_sp.AAC.1
MSSICLFVAQLGEHADHAPYTYVCAHVSLNARRGELGHTFHGPIEPAINFRRRDPQPNNIWLQYTNVYERTIRLKQEAQCPLPLLPSVAFSRHPPPTAEIQCTTKM